MTEKQKMYLERQQAMLQLAIDCKWDAKYLFNLISVQLDVVNQNDDVRKALFDVLEKYEEKLNNEKQLAGNSRERNA